MWPTFVRLSQVTGARPSHDSRRSAFVVSGHHRQSTGVRKANPHPLSTHVCFLDMLRAGISLPALMHLMGHATDSNHHGLPSIHSTGCLGAVRLARSPQLTRPTPGRSRHETTTFSAPTTPADEVLRARRGIGHDFVGLCIRHILPRNSSSLSDSHLGAQYSEVRSLQQLHRDPHLLGWLALLGDRTTRRSPTSHAQTM